MNLLSPTSQARVEEVLVTDGLLSDSELSQLKNEALKQKKPVLAYIIQTGRISDEQLTKALAEIGGVPYVNLSNLHVDAKILGLLPKDLAVHYMAVPIGEMQNKLVVAMLDADNVQAVDFLSNRIGRPLKVYAASEAGIRRVIEQYGNSNLVGGLTSMLNANTLAEKAKAAAKEPQPAPDKEGKIQTIVQDSPISQALSAILEYAAKNKASDVHIEALEHELKIRCRVDGVLKEILKLPKSAEAPLISRIKILSNLKIDEHRTPQDGQFTVKADGRDIDLRITISPVIWGEQVVIRLLDKSDASLQLNEMGYNAWALGLVKKALQMPYGMILTSGPTGSGKTRCQ